MSLPGNRTKHNTETGSPSLTVERRPQQVRGQPGYFAVCLERAHWPGVWEHSRCRLRKPQRGLWPFDQRNRKSFPVDVADEGSTHSPLQGRRRITNPLPVRPSAGFSSSTGLSLQSDSTSKSCPYSRPPATGTDVPPPQQEHPPPPAPVPARALAEEPESENESPPLQGEPALATGQDRDSQDD
ncbi:hypothetical protein R6Z07F_014857 [Ovis aries]